ncbi:helix-turn-helix domain-containing protein [Calorimonas adulescens]|uniref:Helix-turn-helix transcriptional regulator n=1 Tax=Calorimonas adulescens TaxID=2606906 RepID=A0A5D8QFJ2_9THEO|nr:helix-turn-helix transcriptional regulator [Calorimonas adulescens]TZE82596.1 helix-turn-helix transcriptional regulator [Calorimonas adulescens]
MFGDVLHRLRKEKHLTQRELADKLSISRSALSLYESNKREPDFATLKKIADFFNVSLDYLLDREVGNTSTNDYKIPDYISEVLKDPDITQAFKELKNMSEEEIKSLAVHLYAIKLMRTKEKESKGTNKS